MRLYVALSCLDEAEWRKGTGWVRFMGMVELCLRRCLRREMTMDGMFAGHVSLYFEDAEASMVEANAPYAHNDSRGSADFSVDVIQNDPHSVNLVQSGAVGWYGKWTNAVVKLYQVSASDAQIRAVHSEALEPLRKHRPYSQSVNTNALLPCCCCPCFYLWPGNWCRTRGLNCTSHVLTALRTGLGRPLVERRVLPGARLPSELVNELMTNGDIVFVRDIVLENLESPRGLRGLVGLVGLVGLAREVENGDVSSRLLPSVFLKV